MEGNSGNSHEDQLLRAWWWRFEEYVLDEDGRIRPAPGAKGTRYDPWDAFQASRRGRPKRRFDPTVEVPRRRVELSYQRLMTIAKEISDSPRRSRPGRPRRTQDELLKWCREFGLLGLLHHQLLAVRVPPAARQPEGFRGMTIVQTSRGWTSEPITRRSRRRSRPLGMAEDMPPGALLRWFPTDDIRWDGFDGEWSHYFAGDSPLRCPTATLGKVSVGPEESDDSALHEDGSWPPLPNEEAFWREYGEPLEEFVGAGLRLAAAIDPLVSAGSEQPDERLVALGIRDLNELARPVSPAVATDAGGRRRLTWGVPSLLGTLALTIMGEICGGARVISCRSCGVPTVTRSERGAYCSARCRERGPAKH